MTDKLSERLEAALNLSEVTDDAHVCEGDARRVFVGMLPEDFEALLREAAELARRVEWQPIETAPTNKFVLVVDGLGDVLVAHNQFGYWYAWVDYVSPELELDGVTHWMPLPEPKTEAV